MFNIVGFLLNAAALSAQIIIFSQGEQSPLSIAALWVNVIGALYFAIMLVKGE